MVNYLAVLVAGVVSMVLGFLWYGPLFGKQWMALQKWSKQDIEKAKQKGMAKSTILGFISALVIAYVLGFFIEMTGSLTLTGGILTGVLAWLGFVGTVSLGMVLWEGKSFNLWVLNNGYNLIQLVIMGAILGVWA